MNEAILVPSAELAARAHAHHPNESAAYRTARTSLLAEEIELRRHIARVAAMRRGLPPGGEVPTDYEFDGTNGPVRMSVLFGDKDTLIIYSFMYGPSRGWLSDVHGPDERLGWQRPTHRAARRVRHGRPFADRTNPEVG